MAIKQGLGKSTRFNFRRDRDIILGGCLLLMVTLLTIRIEDPPAQPSVTQQIMEVRPTPCDFSATSRVFDVGLRVEAARF